MKVPPVAHWDFDDLSVEVHHDVAPSLGGLVDSLATTCGLTPPPPDHRLFHVVASVAPCPGPRVVGACVAVPVPLHHEAVEVWCDWYDAQPADLAEVAALCVDRPFRERGVAVRVALAAVDELVRAGRRPVAVVALANTGSLGALRAAGLAEVAVLDDPSGVPHRYLAHPSL